MTKIAAAAVLAFASTGAMAVSVSTGGVFNMHSQAGLDLLGVNAPAAPIINVDATISGFVDQAAGTWGVSSSTPFYGVNWFASNGLLYTAPGDYVMNTTTGAVTLAAPTTNVVDGLMHFQVGAGQVGGSIDFAWGASSGIRVVNVWNVNANGSLTAAAVPGMENGPFVGFNAEFNLSNPGLITPVPEASTYGMMLAGLGLVGFAVRRRKLMA